MNNAYLIARRYLAESIYHLTKLDNLNTTFPETKALIDGGIVTNMNLHDVCVISNLKRAWETMLVDLDSLTFNELLSIEYFERINAIVGRDLVINAGNIRTSTVGIGYYIPPLPSRAYIGLKLREISACQDPLQQVSELLCFAIKSQNFYDANKRTAFIVANALLIKHNIGIIIVKENQILLFNQLLTSFLMLDDARPLQEFLINTCVEFQPDYHVLVNKEYQFIHGFVNDIID